MAGQRDLGTDPGVALVTAVDRGALTGASTSARKIHVRKAIPSPRRERLYAYDRTTTKT
jgi:hypothetical protein